MNLNRFTSSFFIIFGLVVHSFGQNTCLPEGIYFKTQSQIDSFPINYKGCSIIEGQVSIRGMTDSSILYLDSLYPIQIIKGGLVIQENAKLLDLCGLENLTHVKYGLHVSENMSLKNLEGLKSLISIGDELSPGSSLSVLLNPSLKNLKGLEKLESIYGSLNISRNDGLENLAGLEQLKNLGDYNDAYENVSIHGNKSLINLIGLGGLDSIGNNLSIFNNDALEGLEGLDQLTYIRSFAIQENDSLKNIGNLDKLTSVGSLYIIANKGLKKIDGFNGLSIAKEGISIEQNGALDSITGFNNLVTVAENTFPYGFMNIQLNKELESIIGLENLKTVNGSMVISGNDQLSNLSGLEGLHYIYRHFWIGKNYNGDEIGNASLESLEALHNLTIVGNHLIITKNPLLLSLSGLDSLDYTRLQNVIIKENPNLSFCEVESICLYLKHNGKANFENNNLNCNTIQEVETACLLLPVENQSRDGIIEIFPNPVSDILYIKSPVSGEATLTIYDMFGHVYFQDYSISMHSIDLNCLSPGHYILSYSTNKKTYTARFLKM